MTGLEIALSVALAASAATDVHSTMRLHGHELNPIMRPFAGHAASLSAVRGGWTAAVIVGSHRLKRSTRLWWVPLAVGTGLNAFASVHNYRER